MSRINRITEADLEQVVRVINNALGLPLQAYIDHKPQAGVYHISHAYGGVALHRMSKEPGCTGITDIFRCGHTTKRDLYHRLCAYADALHMTNEAQRKAAS